MNRFYFCSLLKVYFYLCVCVYVNVKRVLEPLKLGFQEVMSSLIGVLQTELRFFRRTGRALNH